jgi:predicted oxidoreductase (fatty acid repression mutant protein)
LRFDVDGHPGVSDLSIHRLENAINLNTKKITEYAAGYGTVMFFEDQAAIDSMAAKIPP